MRFRNAVRRSYVKNLIDGLWHHLAVAKSLMVVIAGIWSGCMCDGGHEVGSYGRWGSPAVLALGYASLFALVSDGITVRGMLEQLMMSGFTLLASPNLRFSSWFVKVQDHLWTWVKKATPFQCWAKPTKLAP